MSETVNQENTNQETGAAAGQEKTFTQAEMDAIIGDRLKRERAKYADYETMKEKAEKYDASEEASKSELQKQTERADDLQKRLDAMEKANNIQKIREKVSSETGIPASLLFGEDEETCNAQAKAIAEYAKPQSYPAVNDGGEVVKPGAKASTGQQFADWFNDQFKK